MLQDTDLFRIHLLDNNGVPCTICDMFAEQMVAEINKSSAFDISFLKTHVCQFVLMCMTVQVGNKHISLFFQI